MFFKNLLPYKISLLLLVSIGIAACQKEPDIKAPTIRPVMSILVSAQGDTVTRSFPGKIGASGKVDLAFQVPGKLVELSLSNGQQVAEGEVLAKLDPRNYESSLKAAKAQNLRASSDFERAKELVAKQLVSRSEFDRKKAQKDIAEAGEEDAQKALDDTQLIAPYAGTIGVIFVDNFQDVNAKQPVLSVISRDAGTEVIINIPENSVLRLSATEQGTIKTYATFDTLPGREFPLSVKEFAQEINERTQTYEVVLAMAPFEESLRILPGMSANVIAVIPQGNNEPGFVLPTTALFADREGQGSQFVWVIDSESNTVSKRQVTIGEMQGENVSIFSGLTEGERIVTAGVHNLNEGDQVKLIASGV